MNERILREPANSNLGVISVLIGSGRKVFLPKNNFGPRQASPENNPYSE